MLASLTATRLQSEAARTGWQLGTTQAEEHVLLTGTPGLSYRQVRALAWLAWKYEGMAMVANKREASVFVDAYALAYRAFRC